MDEMKQESEMAGWAERLRERRKACGVSQETLAERAGIGKTYLSKLEKGKRIAGKALRERLEKALGSLLPENEMETGFRYMRIRFPTRDAGHIMEEVMKVRVECFQKEPRALYGYTGRYVTGDIVVMISKEKEKGTLLEMNGKGCRQFETYLNGQGRTWFDFFEAAEEAGAVWKQITIVLGDRAGILDVAELTEKCRKNEWISCFSSYRDYPDGSSVPVGAGDSAMKGRTLFLGSAESDICFCIYENKGAGNCFELRMKNNRAQLAIADLLQRGDVAETAFSIINRYVRFVDHDTGKERRYWKKNRRWLWFLHEEKRRIKLTAEPVRQTIMAEEIKIPDRKEEITKS